MQQPHTLRIRYRLVVTGTVQGVWYRKSAVSMGTDLGLSGYAMNQADGSVLIEAEGPPEQLERFIGWCRTGPPLARVEHVALERMPPGGPPGFVVRY